MTKMSEAKIRTIHKGVYHLDLVSLLWKTCQKTSIYILQVSDGVWNHCFNASSLWLHTSSQNVSVVFMLSEAVLVRCRVSKYDCAPTLSSFIGVPWEYGGAGGIVHYSPGNSAGVPMTLLHHRHSLSKCRGLAKPWWEQFSWRIHCHCPHHSTLFVAVQGHSDCRPASCCPSALEPPSGSFHVPHSTHSSVSASE